MKALKLNKYLLVIETSNTLDSPLDYDKVFSEFAIIRRGNMEDKKRCLKYFKQPTITDDLKLLKEGCRLSMLCK